MPENDLLIDPSTCGIECSICGKFIKLKPTTMVYFNHYGIPDDARICKECYDKMHADDIVFIQTWEKDNEDLNLLSNTLNAEAGRFRISDKHVYYVLLRAQAAIEALRTMLREERIKNKENKNDT